MKKVKTALGTVTYTLKSGVIKVALDGEEFMTLESGKQNPTKKEIELLIVEAVNEILKPT